MLLPLEPLALVLLQGELSALQTQLSGLQQAQAGELQGRWQVLARTARYQAVIQDLTREVTELKDVQSRDKAALQVRAREKGVGGLAVCFC